MKLALLILFVLGTAFVVSEACQNICSYRTVYVRVCNVYWCRIIAVRRLVCVPYGCGKRSMQPQVEIGYPCNFTEYDTNGNGQIDKAEFQKALKTSQSAAVLESFKEWDDNGDGVISCGEFMTSSEEFQCKPKGCKLMKSKKQADEELWTTK